MKLVIRGGEIVTAGSRFTADLLVVDGVVAQLGGTMPTGEDATEIDAAGKLVLPGGVDMHVHLSPAYVPAGIGPGGVPTAADDPNAELEQSWSDDFASGSRAAAAGGVTTFGNMTFSHVGERLKDSLARTARDAERDSIVDFVLHPILLSACGMLEQIPDVVEAGSPSIKFFMMFPSFDAEAAEYLQLMRAAAEHDLVTMIHCEDACVVGHVTQRLLAAGHSHPTNYGRSRPVSAEASAVARAAAFAEAADATLYVVHISSEAALDAVRQARTRGVDVRVETRPIYLLFDTSYLERPDGPLYIGNPPLRAESDIDALWAGLADGTVDTCCTDHAPTLKIDKVGPDRDITNVAPGMADLETMLPLLYSEGVHNGRITLERFVEVTATNAAKVFGIYPQKGTIAVGGDADLVIWDPAGTRTFDASRSQTRTDYSLYDGWTLNGEIVATISRGEVVYERGEIVATGGRGRLVRRSGRTAG
ncbi:MAG: amidohydrolase family protein [Geodermatophilaceae bacterium]